MIRKIARLTGLSIPMLLGCAPHSDTDAPQPQTAQQRASVAPSTPVDACGGIDPSALLDTGHAAAVFEVARVGDRVLSVANGRWILWDTTARRQLASGKHPIGRWTWRFPPQLAGDTALVWREGRIVEVRDARDARVLSTIDVGRTYAPLGLAVDGSYVYRTDGQDLQVFSRTGQLLLERRGDYANAAIHAAPEGLRVVARPDGDGSIEYLPVREGGVATSVPFVQREAEWFADGQYFFGSSRTESKVYDRAGLAVHTLGDLTRTEVGGYRDLIWALAAPNTLQVTRLGEPRALATFALPALPPPLTDYVASAGQAGSVVGILPRAAILAQEQERGQFAQLDLRGAEPRLQMIDLPGRAEVHDSDTNGRWAVGSERGVVHDGVADSPGEVGTLGCGPTRAVATSAAGRAAIATSDGKVRVYDLAAARLLVTIDVRTDALQMSDDGKVVVTQGERRYIATSKANALDQSVRVFSAETGALLHRFAHARDDQPALMDFDLSADGRRIARRLCELADFQGGNTRKCTVHVSDLQGVPEYQTATVTYAEVGNPSDREPPYLSPSGRRLAFAVPRGDGWLADTVLYEDGKLLRTIPGRVYGWVDETSLIVQPPVGEVARVLVDLQGNPIEAVTIRAPQARAIDALHYEDSRNVLRFADGAVVFRAELTPAGSEARIMGVAGDHVLIERESKIDVFKWR